VTSISPAQAEDEIDLVELFAAIWARKGKVTAIASASFLAAIVYATQIATPVFEASARFELNEAEPARLGDLGGLASLAGINVGRGGTSEADKLEDRILSRPFLDKIAAPAGLYQDPVFNPTLAPPGLRAQAKDLLGLDPGPPPGPARITAAVAARFADALTIELKDNGVIALTVVHPDPDRAAEIANLVVRQVLEDLFRMRREEAREKLDYFAQELYEVRVALDGSAQALKDYSLANNLRSTEELAQSSAQLVSLRKTREDIAQTGAALTALAGMAKSGATFDKAARDAFVKLHPIAASLEFRRRLGWPNDEAGWRLPAQSDIAALRRDLAARDQVIERSISRLEQDARDNAEAATELEELRRELKVNEAIYEAMIKQFETESFSSGFAVESGEMIETAIPPIEPAAPRTALIAALGLVLGTVGGTGAALLLSVRQGTLHSARAVADATGMPDVAHLDAGFRRLRGPGPDAWLHRVRGCPRHGLADMAARHAPAAGQHLALIPAGVHPLAKNAALGLADTLHADAGGVCLVDLSAERVLGSPPGDLQSRGPGWTVCSLGDGPDLAWPDPPARPGETDGLRKRLHTLASHYGRLVLFCPPPSEGTAITESLLAECAGFVVLAQTGQTTRNDAATVATLRARHPEIPGGLVLA